MNDENKSKVTTKLGNKIHDAFSRGNQGIQFAFMARCMVISHHTEVLADVKCSVAHHAFSNADFDPVR